MVRSAYTIAAVVPACEAEARRVCETDKIAFVAKPNDLLLTGAERAWQSGDLNLRAANGEGRHLVWPPPWMLDIEPMQRMFLTQPPATEVAVTIFTDRGERRPPTLTREAARCFQRVRSDRGVRYGDVLDCVRSATEGWEHWVIGVALDFEGLVFAETVEEWREAERQVWVWENGERIEEEEREEIGEQNEEASWAEEDRDFAYWAAGLSGRLDDGITASRNLYLGQVL